MSDFRGTRNEVVAWCCAGFREVSMRLAYTTGPWPPVTAVTDVVFMPDTFLRYFQSSDRLDFPRMSMPFINFIQ